MATHVQEFTVEIQGKTTKGDEKEHLVEVSACGDHSPGQIIIDREAPIGNRNIKKEPAELLRSRAKVKISHNEVRTVSRVANTPVLRKPYCPPRNASRPPQFKKRPSKPKLGPKTSSMVDLGRNGESDRETVPIHQRFKSRSSTSTVPAMQELETLAAGRVYRALVLNAWRKRRCEVDSLSGSLAKRTGDIEHLQIQITVLRNLFTAEQKRLVESLNETQQLRASLDNNTKEREVLIEERDVLLQRLAEYDSRCENQITTINNLKNDLQNSCDQAIAAETQLQRERDKVNKLRDDKKFLLDKVQSMDETIKSKEKLMHEQSEKLQLKMEDELKDKEDEISRLNASFVGQEEIIAQLSEELAIATSPQVDEPQEDEFISTVPSFNPAGQSIVLPPWAQRMCHFLVGSSLRVLQVLAPVLPPPSHVL